MSYPHHPFPPPPHHFPHPPVMATGKATVKLALEAPNAEKEGPFVRVQLMDEIGPQSLEMLRERSLTLWKMDNPAKDHQMQKAKVTFTYRDTENDLCYIFSDEDLRGALPLFPACLRVFARVEIPKKNKVEAASTQTAQQRSFSDIPAHKIVEAVVGVLTTSAVALQNNVSTAAVATNTEAPTTEASPENVQDKQVEDKKEEKLPFIHGRHTCDACLVTPIIGKRYHAVNLVDYDLCASCKDNYKGDEITFEEAQLDRDIPMQERWNRRFVKFQLRNDKKQEKMAKKQEVRCGKPMGGPPRGPPFGPPAHCHGPGPRGPRCGGGRGRWNQHPRFHPNGGPDQEQVDLALKEAIRRSMLDLKKDDPEKNEETETEKDDESISQESIEQPKEVVKEEKSTKTKEEEFEIPPEAPFVAQLSPRSIETNTVKEPTVVPATIEKKEASSEEPPSEESFSDDAPGDVAASIGKTLDLVASAIDELGAEFARHGTTSNVNEKKNADVTEEYVDASKAGATILQGEDNEEEQEEEASDDESKHSQNSWDVVSGDQLASDAALARAAQVIGSALFESANGGSAAGHSVSMLGSDHSVPTTLPSVASEKGAAQDAQKERWALQLSQLRELGFKNEEELVEIMDRLQAANIGCGEEDAEITVAQVVNDMMKGW